MKVSIVGLKAVYSSSHSKRSDTSLNLIHPAEYEHHAEVLTYAYIIKNLAIIVIMHDIIITIKIIIHRLNLNA